MCVLHLTRETRRGISAICLPHASTVHHHPTENPTSQREEITSSRSSNHDETFLLRSAVITRTLSLSNSSNRSNYLCRMTNRRANQASIADSAHVVTFTKISKACGSATENSKVPSNHRNQCSHLAAAISKQPGRVAFYILPRIGPASLSAQTHRAR